jgi:Mrp family chromosome partitioning ATPase
LPSRPDLEPLAQAEERPDSPFGSYVHAVRAHRWIFAAVLLAVVLGALLWVAARSSDYQANSQIIVNPLSPDDAAFIGLSVIKNSGDPTRTIQTAATLLRSPQAAALTASRMGPGWSSRRVLDAVHIEPVGESDILAVSATAGTPDGAARLANTFSRATLDVRDAQLRRQIAPVIARLRVTGRQLPKGDVSAAADVEQRLAQLEDVQSSGDPSVSLSRSAAPPTSPEGAPGWLILLLAIIGGTLLASGVVLIVARVLPARLRDERELSEILPAPVLARIPGPSRAWARRRRSSPLAVAPDVLAAFRNVQLQVSLLDGDHRRILLASPSPGDGRTACVVAFAVQLADAGQRVTLLDLDLREPRLARALGVVPRTDLGAALAPGGTLADALVEVPGLPSVSVAPGIADTSMTTLDELGRRLPKLLDKALLAADVVLMDTSPLGAVGDALRFVAAADDVLVVVRPDHTEIESLQVMRDMLARARTPPLGYLIVGQSRPTGGPAPLQESAPAGRRPAATKKAAANRARTGSSRQAGRL